MVIDITIIITITVVGFTFARAAARLTPKTALPLDGSRA